MDRGQLVGTAILVGLLGVVLLAIVGWQAAKVRDGLDTLTLNATDNLTWNLAQAETEYQRVVMAARMFQIFELDAEERRPELRPNFDVYANLVNRFDIFYSRIQTLRESPLYAELREDEGFGQSLARIQAYLDAQAGLIDGERALLERGIRGFVAASIGLIPEVRQIALSGVTISAVHLDEHRQEAEAMLRDLGLVMATTLWLLGSIAALLWTFGTQFRRNARRFAIQAERLRAIIETSPLPILVTDGRSVIRECNGAALERLGYPQAELIGTSADDLLDRQGTRPQDLEKIEAAIGRQFYPQDPEDTAAPLQARLRCHDGSTFPAEVWVAPPAKGGEQLWVTFFRDVSTWVDSYAELRDARDKAKSGELAKERVLATVSHEMRTPLHGIMNALQLLQARPLDPRQERLARSMSFSAEMLMRQIDDLLTAASIEGGGLTVRRTPVDVDEFVATLAEETRWSIEQGGNRLVMHRPHRPVGAALLDRARLGQVLNNIIGNANKFTTHGTLEFAHFIDLPRNEIVFRISDTGTGIRPEDMQKIFDDFYTTSDVYTRSHRGVGLGLGVVRRILAAMNGTIALDSTPGLGTTVEIRLPLIRVVPPARTTAVAAPRDAADAMSMTVLLAEDNALNREILAEGLRAQGVEIVEVENGREAVEAALGQAFDVILMDVSMPEMDGTEATRAIRSGPGPNARTPIVAITAHAFPEQKAELMTSGFDTILVKPILTVTLHQCLIDLVKRKSALPAPAAPAGEGPLRAPEIDEVAFADVVSVFGVERSMRILGDFGREIDLGKRVFGDMLDRGAYRDLERALHKLKGSCGLLGASGLADLIARCEACAARGNRHECEALLARFATIGDDTIDRLKSLL